MELSKILKEEAWLESEKYGRMILMSNPVVWDRSIKIWEGLHEDTNDTNDNKLFLDEEY